MNEARMPISQQKVADIQRRIAAALGGHDFNYGEMIVGVVHVLGRLVVDTCENGVEIEDRMKLIRQQLSVAIRAGASARGKNRMIIGG